jgi:hypothetical protein
MIKWGIFYQRQTGKNENLVVPVGLSLLIDSTRKRKEPSTLPGNDLGRIQNVTKMVIFELKKTKHDIAYMMGS